MSGQGTIIRIALEFLHRVRERAGASATPGTTGGTSWPWSTDQRRTALQAFAKHALAQPNKAQAFLNILARAIELSEGARDRAGTVIGDIKAVLIGKNAHEGRGTGPYYVGEDGGVKSFIGSTGFKPDMRDSQFQVQHAAAGLVFGYQPGEPVYGPSLEAALRLYEDEAQDDALYRATLPVGHWLSHLDQDVFIRPDAMVLGAGGSPDERLTALPSVMMQAICDDTCTVPPTDSLRPFDMEADARARESDLVAGSGHFDMAADAQQAQARAVIDIGADVVDQARASTRPVLDILGVDTQ